MSYKILLVDDDLENLEVNKELFEEWGYRINTAKSGSEAIKTIKNAREDYALVLMDYHMPKFNGDLAISEIKAFKPHQQIVVFSMDDTQGPVRDSFVAGAADFLNKNVENDILQEKIKGYCAKFESNFKVLRHQVDESDEKANYILETGFVGVSSLLYDLSKIIRKVGPTLSNVLILGETGTGKELVAKALHRFSNRSSKNFVGVNVAAEPANLIDSSLFGHTKGSFTGATDSQIGKVRLADGGTLFLDEIGDLSLEMQVKLLRVLQEKEVQPVGANKPIKVDVRIIAATHRDLKKMVADGTFREDLYYRIATICLKTPALRDRPEDIGPLITKFAEQVCKNNSLNRQFQKNCLDIFKSYRWPGNVRELQLMVERHIIESEVSLIKPENLDAILYSESVKSDGMTIEDIDAKVKALKSKLLSDVLNQTSSKAEAARRLGVSPAHLHYLLNPNVKEVKDKKVASS